MHTDSMQWSWCCWGQCSCYFQSGHHVPRSSQDMVSVSGNSDHNNNYDLAFYTLFIKKNKLQFTSSYVSKAMWISLLAHSLGNFAYANTSIFFRQFSAFREQGQTLNFSASVITVMYPLSSKQLFNVFQPGLKISHKSQNNRQILIITTSVRRSQFYGEGVTETLRFLWCFLFFFFFPEKIASW